jgi:2-oxoglutarate dehydrogenase E2 component (dihydrolipoamide succinyltransferase)
MADLVIPKLGESISEAVIAKWLKQVGEPIAVDEPVVDLETDKVSVALPAPAAGVLAEQRFAAGDTVKVGEIIGTITVGAAPKVVGQPAEQVAPAPRAADASKAATAGGGAPVAAPATAPSTNAGAATAASAATVSAGAATGAATVSAGAATGAATAGAAGDGHGVPHSKTLPPSVRKALREGAQLEPPARPAAARTPQPPPVAGEREELVAMSPLRRRIAERLVEAQHTAAILTTFNEVDMTNVMALRARFQDDFVKRHGIKLGFMSFFVRACVESLKRFPGVNAELRGDHVLYKKHYDFGIAVGGGKGLVVPVVRNVDALSLAGIEKEIARLAERAKNNMLTLDELSGGTFSISNGGIYGSMMSTPLLNMPQTGILGMHNIIKRPIAVGDAIELRPMMYLALSYDHRVVDGREAVQFLVGVKERIEAPERLMLEL